jgi:RimJ/RimL family protein N-acetyltransferase
MKPIYTSRFIIRAFNITDLVNFTRYRQQPCIAKYQSWSSYSLEDAHALYDDMQLSKFGTEGYWFQLAIADKVTDELLGDIAVHFIDDCQIELGFTIAPASQKQGIAFEAVSTFINYLFDELNKHRIIAITDVENIASINLLEKLGFRREAHFIDNVFFKGAWGSEYQYALLQREWKALNNSLI